jgi:hypothetical protein
VSDEEVQNYGARAVILGMTSAVCGSCFLCGSFSFGGGRTVSVCMCFKKKCK